MGRNLLKQIITFGHTCRKIRYMYVMKKISFKYLQGKNTLHPIEGADTVSMTMAHHQKIIITQQKI